MKLKFLFLLIFTSYMSYSQDLVNNIINSKSCKVEDYGFTNEGNFYCLTKDKELNTNDKTSILSVFNKNTLEKILAYKPEEKFKIRNISPDGNSILYSSKSKYKIFNNSGKIKTLTESKIEGNLYREYSKLNLLSDNALRVDFMDFSTNDAHYVIAPKQKDGKQRHILKRPFNLETSSYSIFEEPSLETQNKRLYWTINKISSSDLVFVAKELINNKEDSYNIVFYNNDFESTKTIALKVLLPENYFCYSNDGNGTSWYDYAYVIKGEVRGGTDAIAGATGNLYTDLQNKTFYAYGLYTNEKEADRMIKPNGYYIYKFDWNGNLIWKQIHEINNNTNFNNRQQAFNFLVKFYKTGKNIGLFLKPDEGSMLHLINIEEVNGNIIAENNIPYSSNINSTGLKKPMFWTYYTSNNTFSSAKLEFDLETIAAAFFNNKFNTYLKSLDKKTKLSFISKIHDSGIIVAQADDKEGVCNLMRFDWD